MDGWNDGWMDGTMDRWMSQWMVEFRWMDLMIERWIMKMHDMYVCGALLRRRKRHRCYYYL